MSRSISIPSPKRERREFVKGTGVRLSLHIRSAKQVIMTARTEALRGSGLTVTQYAAILSLYHVPEQSLAQLARAATIIPQTMTTVIAKLKQRQLVTHHPSFDHAKILITSFTTESGALLLRIDKVARRVEQRMIESFTAKERQQLTEMLGRVTSLLHDDLIVEWWLRHQQLLLSRARDYHWLSGSRWGCSMPYIGYLILHQ